MTAQSTGICTRLGSQVPPHTLRHPSQSRLQAVTLTISTARRDHQTPQPSGIVAKAEQAARNRSTVNRMHQIPDQQGCRARRCLSLLGASRSSVVRPLSPAAAEHLSLPANVQVVQGGADALIGMIGLASDVCKLRRKSGVSAEGTCSAEARSNE